VRKTKEETAVPVSRNDGLWASFCFVNAPLLSNVLSIVEVELCHLIWRPSTQLAGLGLGCIVWNVQMNGLSCRERCWSVSWSIWIKTTAC
jgi:hypothetical protein